MILKELSQIESKAERLDFVKANKAKLIKAKKSIIKRAEPVYVSPTPVKNQTAAKMDGSNSSGVFEIIGNSIGFYDHHEDVSMKGSFSKTVKEGGQFAPIIINHNHSPDSIFAKNLGVEIKEIPIRSLGFDKEGTTEVLAAKIAPIYNSQMKQLYENGEIKQHSVGIKYQKIELAINDPSDDAGYANWKKYIDQVINREEVEESKYFFAVLEQQLFEISAVLFGSNAYTPTLDQNKSLLNTEPDTSTLPIKEPLSLIHLFDNA